MTILTVLAVLVGIAALWLARSGALVVRILMVSFAVSSWNAIQIHGVPPSDALPVLAFVLGILRLSTEHRTRVAKASVALPRGMMSGAYLFVLAGFASAVLPASRSFLVSHRLQETAIRGASVSLGVSELLKFELALIILPIAVMLARPTVEQLKQLAVAWAAGIVVSATVALIDFNGLTRIEASLAGLRALPGRQSGLTVQPNHLAVSAVMAVPVVLYWMTTGRKAGLVGAAALAILAGAVYVSGSRGGAGGFALAVFAMVRLVPALRTRLRIVRWMGAAWIFGNIALALRLADRLSAQLRLTADNGGAEQSNAARANLRADALADFLHRPLSGVGFNRLTGAHEVHVQILASAGILGACAYFLYFFTIMRKGNELRHIYPGIGDAVWVSCGVWLVMGFVENQIADRYLYVPVGLIVGFAWRQRVLSMDPDLAPCKPGKSSSDLLAM